MIRALSILAALVALAVSAAPASAGWQKPKPAPSITDGTSNTVQFRNAEKGRSAGKVANHTEGTVSIIWNNGDGNDLKKFKGELVGIEPSLRKAPPRDTAAQLEPFGTSSGSVGF